MELLRKLTKGQSLVEIILAMGLAAVLLPSLLTGLIASRQGRPQLEQRLEATRLSHEAIEALRIVRNSGWSNVATSGIYHPVNSGTTWTLSSSLEVIGDFTRQILITDVFRNSAGQIVATGGTFDPSTKKAEIRLTWSLPRASFASTVLYLSRHRDNQAFINTTQADFLPGILINTSVPTAFGGEVNLAHNTKGKWCEPYISSVAIDLPGAPIAVSAVEGHVFAATGSVAQASQDSFAHVLVANTDPPQFTLHGKIKGYKTNAVFGDTNWGYVATSDNGREVVIINLNQFDDAPNKIYHQEGYFNTPSQTTDADSLFILGTRGYVTAGNYLYVFDLASHSGSRPQVGSRIQFANSGDKAGEIYGRVVNGRTYVYIAITGSTVEELKIAEVTNPSQSSQWRIVGSINIEPNNCSTLESGQAVFVRPDGSRAYLASVNDTSFKEFFAIDTSSKTSPSLVGGVATNPPCTNGGGYEAGGMNPEQSVVVSTAENRAVLVGVDDPNHAANSEEYQVLDLSNEAQPVRCGGLQFNQGIYGIAGVKETDGDAYAYIITGDSANELKVIQGGPDGTYAESGTYESNIYDPGFSVAFNRFFTTSVLPPNTDLKVQVAVSDPVSGSCTGSNFNFVGPDLTSSTYFTASGGAIPVNDDGAGFENPARCFKYKTFLSTTDYNTSPALWDITVNYSP